MLQSVLESRFVSTSLVALCTTHCLVWVERFGLVQASTFFPSLFDLPRCGHVTLVVECVIRSLWLVINVVFRHAFA